MVLLVVLVVVKLDGKLPRTRTTENLATQQTLMKMTLEKRGITFACLPWDRQQRCNLAAAYLSLHYVALRLLLYNHRVQNITITRARRRCITSVGVFALSMWYVDFKLLMLFFKVEEEALGKDLISLFSFLTFNLC